jgi:[ribosomal protein S18]-alanine N-acetyltransferase
MHVGLMQPEDVPAVAELAAAMEVELDVAAEAARGFARIWLARPAPGAAPVAFAVGWDVADELHVIHVATHPSWRRRGAARKVMAALLDHAAERRARLVLLEVRRSNRPALELYQSLGFSAIRLRAGYYAEGGEDAVEMMLALDPATGELGPPEDPIAIDRQKW